MNKSVFDTTFEEYFTSIVEKNVNEVQQQQQQQQQQH